MAEHLGGQDAANHTVNQLPAPATKKEEGNHHPNNHYLEEPTKTNQITKSKHTH
ncbi:MAG: hypothetical protein QM753_16130 [Thermomicrobiales bacterium]